MSSTFSNRLSIAGLCVTLAFCSSVPVAAADTCVSSEMSLAHQGPFTSPEAALDSTSTYAGQVEARGAYDIPQGTLLIYHGGYLVPSYVKARDLYDVSGVAPGTPVTLTAELEFDGTISTPGCGASGCWGYMAASIQWGTGSAQDVQQKNLISDYSMSEPVHGKTSLPITIVAGHPELIEFKLSGYRSAGGNQVENGTGRFRFVGLDPSVRVVSCNGYGAQVVPVRTASWGNLKLRYR